MLYNETLGGLVDKLSITLLKLFHTQQEMRECGDADKYNTSQAKSLSLLLQGDRLKAEIDSYHASAVQDPSSVVLTNPSNKVYKNGPCAEAAHASTLAGLVSELVQANIEMWHCQEVTYDQETLERFTKQEMLDYLNRAARLNIERNQAIDRLDNFFAGLVS